MVSRPLPRQPLGSCILGSCLVETQLHRSLRPRTRGLEEAVSFWQSVVSSWAPPLSWGRASPRCLGPACAGTCGTLKWVSRASARWVRLFTAPKFGAGWSSLGRKGNPAWNRVYSCRTKCEPFQGDVKLPLGRWLVLSKYSATVGAQGGGRLDIHRQW